MGESFSFLEMQRGFAGTYSHKSGKKVVAVKSYK